MRGSEKSKPLEMGELDTRGGLASKDWVRVCVPLCLIAIGILVRMAAFGSAPAGFNQDEAFAGYETWSLLTYGVDSWGSIPGPATLCPGAVG